MSQPIQRPDISVRLQELFRLVGRVRPSIEEYVIPTVQVADLGIAAAPPVRRVAMHGGLIGAVAAEYSCFQIENPARSNNVIQLRWMEMTPGSATSIYGSFVDGTWGTKSAVGTEQYSDRRSDDPLALLYSGTQDAAGIVQQAAASTFRILRSAGANSPVWNMEHVVLDPGAVFTVTMAAVNIALYYTIVWEEFALI